MKQKLAMLMLMFSATQVSATTEPGLVYYRGQLTYAVETLISSSDSILESMHQGNPDFGKALTCVAKTFVEWADPVYESALKDADLYGEDSTRYLFDEREHSRRFLQEITKAHPAMVKAVEQVQMKWKEEGNIPVVPANLTYATYYEFKNPYQNAVAQCVDGDFLQEVDEAIGSH